MKLYDFHKLLVFKPYLKYLNIWNKSFSNINIEIFGTLLEPSCEGIFFFTYEVLGIKIGWKGCMEFMFLIWHKVKILVGVIDDMTSMTFLLLTIRNARIYNTSGGPSSCSGSSSESSSSSSTSATTTSSSATR